MAITFTIGEILQMAEQIEKTGARFYRRAAAIRPDCAALLHEIAEQEDRHFEIFSSMAGQLSDQDRVQAAFDPYDEGSVYLESFVQNYSLLIHQDPSEALSGETTVNDILSQAVQLEKDSIVFYSGLRDLVPAPDGKAAVDHIIREETRHIGWLSGRRAELRG